MATMTATNQQYYGSYPVVHNVSNMANTNGAQAYQQQQQQYSQQIQPYHAQHHQHVTVNNQSLTQLGQTQRTVSASTNSSTAAALYAIEATKSTKGASKERRDKINTQIAQLRELLPLPASTRQRLSQLQLMALVLVYVRKSNYFCNAFGNYGIAREPSLTIPASGFSKALNGFLMMLTQKGKLLYISDNAAEYLGHSMEDLLSHGDEVYDIIEDQDKKTIRTELLSNDDESQSSPSSKSSSLQQSASPPTTETRIALCRMNVSRNARRQMRFGDQKVVLIEGHYFGYLPLSSRNEPVFLASCTPIAMPETRECVVQGSTNVFTSIHSMDMKFLYIDGIGEHHLNCTRQQIQGMSWYELIHTDHLHEAQQKHKRITANDQERSTIVLLRMMNVDQTGFVWVHSVMQVKEATDTATQPVIVCTNQVLSEREAQVMRSNLWLYQFYSLHSKMHCNYSANSPSAHNNQSDSPNSVCSDSEEPVRCKSESNQGAAATINTSSSAAGVAGELSKSPPANPLISGQQHATSLVGESSPTRSETFTSQDNYGTSNNGCANGGVSYGGGYQSSLQIQPHKTTSNAASAATPSSKLSPPTQSSPSSSSPLSSSSSYGQQQRYHQLGPSVITNPLINIKHTTDISVNHHHHHHHNSSNSVGSSSVSSTSSSSSSSDSATPSALTTAGLVANPGNSGSLTTGSQNVAQTMAAAVTVGGPASLYATAAGIDAIDPLQHMHHSHHHHHPMYQTAATAAATSQHQHSHLHQPTSHHHHAAAAVNYATHVMAAQRVAHQQSHHHHPYHPYQHHQHHHQAVHGHHQATAATATTNHLAPHHHNHHTTPHALYAPAHHHHAASAAVASTAAFNNAFNHHHHHHAAAAYHSAATVAAAGAASHPVHHHHHSANTHMQNPYHSANVAAAAAAAHQGVSFHYSKIAAAVNASA